MAEIALASPVSPPSWDHDLRTCASVAGALSSAAVCSAAAASAVVVVAAAAAAAVVVGVTSSFSSLVAVFICASHS